MVTAKKEKKEVAQKLQLSMLAGLCRHPPSRDICSARRDALLVAIALVSSPHTLAFSSLPSSPIMPARVLPARTTSVLDNLSTAIPKIFDQVQNSTSNHQKNHIALYKLQTQAAAHTEDIPGRGNKLIGERAFENVIIDMINRILVVKKAGNLDPATRCLKFIGSYIKFIHDKCV